MKKNNLIIAALFFIIPYIISSQTFELKLKNISAGSNISAVRSANKYYSKTGIPASWYLAAIINPMLVIEDKKIFFGLTKEISAGIFPYGRLAFEYSYIFRSYNTSHLRFSYNYDFILAAGDFVGFIATPGAGFFTDTKNNGWFLQGSVSALLGPGEPLMFNPYLKYRHTFIKEKTKSNIHDISLGVGFAFFL